MQSFLFCKTGNLINLKPSGNEKVLIHVIRFRDNNFFLKVDPGVYTPTRRIRKELERTKTLALFRYFSYYYSVCLPLPPEVLHRRLDWYGTSGTVGGVFEVTEFRYYIVLCHLMKFSVPSKGVLQGIRIRLS